MTDSTSPLIETNIADQVLEVTLSAPPDNRISFAMLEALGEALDRFETDDALRLMLIRGAGKTFSKGFDLSLLEAGTSETELRQSLVLSNALFSRLAACHKPTVAAISGACLGGGLELAVACHFRLCSDRARLGLPEIWIKLVPGLGGAFRVCKLVGQAKALEMVALGDLVSPEDALRIHLVNRVFGRKEFDARVDGFIKALLMADADALTAAIRLVTTCGQFDDDENVQHGLEAFSQLALSWSPSTE